MSPLLGKPFSSPIVSSHDASTLLRKVCESSFITQLTSLLGKDSSLHLVGGTVRDAFLGQHPSDLDLASRLHPEEVKEALQSSAFRVVDSGLSHGTVLLVHDLGQAELTTFRKASPRDFSAFSQSIEEDLSGRDFTVNAIAFEVATRTVVDPFAGVKDLSDSLVRAVNNPVERFEEDPLRILRMIRFGPADNRRIDLPTEKAALTLKDRLSEISPERIRDELFKTLLASAPASGLKAYRDLGLLSIILPEAIPSVGFEQNRFHSEDVFEHTLSVIERSPQDLVLRLAALFHDLGKPETLSVDDRGDRHFYKHEQVSEQIARSVLERFHAPKQETSSVAKIVKHHMRPLDCGEPGVRRILRDLGSDFDKWLLFKRADAPPLMPEEEFEGSYRRFVEMVDIEKVRRKGPAYGKLAINGNDLIQIGVKPGPDMGKILSELEEQVLDDPSRNTRQELIALAKGLIS